MVRTCYGVGFRQSTRMNLAFDLLRAISLLTVILLLCITIECLSPVKRYSLSDRFPGALFVILTPVFAIFMVPPAKALLAATGIGPIINLQSLPDFAQLAIIFVGMDFAIYWQHRFEHRFMWNFHAVHHSPRELHAANGYAHPLVIVSNTVFTVVPLTLVGLDGIRLPLLAGLLISFQGLFVHSPTRVHLGPLRHIIVDHRFHRIHHSRDQRHYDKNFATIFSIWDRMFGTAYFPSKSEYPDVGLDDREPPQNLFQFLLQPFRSAKRESAAPKLDQSLHSPANHLE